MGQTTVSGPFTSLAGITNTSFDGAVIGGTTPAAGTFTALTATGAVALSPASANVVLSPTGTGVVTINPATAGTMNNVSVGVTTPLAGKFTTLTATGAITATNATSTFSDLISNDWAQSNTLLSTTNSTLANIVGMSVTLTAGGVYNFQIHLNGTSGATGGVKVAFVASGGLTSTSFNCTTWNYNGTTLNAVTNQTTLNGNLTSVAAIYTDIVSKGCFTVNAGGTLTLQGAQNTTNGTATTFLANGCFMNFYRVA